MHNFDVFKDNALKWFKHWPYNTLASDVGSDSDNLIVQNLLHLLTLSIHLMYVGCSIIPTRNGLRAIGKTQNMLHV